jgi:hypothetical protein
VRFGKLPPDRHHGRDSGSREARRGASTNLSYAFLRPAPRAGTPAPFFAKSITDLDGFSASAPIPDPGSLLASDSTGTTAYYQDAQGKYQWVGCCSRARKSLSGRKRTVAPSMAITEVAYQYPQNTPIYLERPWCAIMRGDESGAACTNIH